MLVEKCEVKRTTDIGRFSTLYWFYIFDIFTTVEVDQALLSSGDIHEVIKLVYEEAEVMLARTLEAMIELAKL